jgi:hypothetical protein
VDGAVDDNLSYWSYHDGMYCGTETDELEDSCCTHSLSFGTAGPTEGIFAAGSSGFNLGEVSLRFAVSEGELQVAREVIRRPKIYSVVAEIADDVVGYGALRETDGAAMVVSGLVARDLQGHGAGAAMAVELCARALARAPRRL